MKTLCLLLLIFGNFAQAALDIEYFDKAASGKHKIDTTLNYTSQKIIYSLVSSPTSEVEQTASETSLLLDYGYGLSESIAIHTNLAYSLGNIEERNTPSNTNDEDNKVSGLSDLGLKLIGNHETGEHGLFHWQLDLSYGLGNNNKKEKSSGPPAEYESNNFTGRTVVTAQMGYAHNIFYGNVGFVLGSEIVKNKADFELETLSNKFNLDVDGGKETFATLLFEMPSEKILWGTSLGNHWVEESEIDLNGSTIDREVAKNFFRFSVYSRLDTGPGQELDVSFGYDIYGKSGGEPASRKLEEGSAFSVLARYSVEF